jgi:hypothetical protein
MSLRGAELRGIKPDFRIKESERLPGHLKEEINGFSYEEYQTKANHAYFKINVKKDAEERVKLFKKQLKLFILSINQVSNIIKKVRVLRNDPGGGISE